MKIYFAGSIRGGRDDKDLYLKIINHLKQYGEVLTEHVGEASLTSFGEKQTSDTFIYNRDMDWVRESGVIISEVTQPSLGVGYELGQAEALGKKILCLHRLQDGKRLSAMVSGNAYFTNKSYASLSEAKNEIDLFISTL